MVTWRAKLVREAGAYPWSSFHTHGLGRPDPLVDPVPAYEALARTAKTRQRRWTKYVHQVPEDEELAAIRRSAATGLPLGDPAWVEQLSQALDLDLTIRPRGRPRKSQESQV